MGSVRIAVLTISDQCSQGEASDVAGASLCEIFSEAPFHVALYAVVPDSVKTVAGALKRWSDDGLCDVIVTTGGTGLSRRDVTVAATRKAIDRELPGLALLVLLEGLKKTPLAALSQGIAGARGSTIIVNLPDSPAAVKEAAAALTAVLPHAVQVIAGDDRDQPSDPVDGRE